MRAWALVLALAVASACSGPSTAPEPAPCEPTLVLVTEYGDTARFRNYTGPPPANLAAVRSWWWESCPDQPTED